MLEAESCPAPSEITVVRTEAEEMTRSSAAGDIGVEDVIVSAKDDRALIKAEALWKYAHKIAPITCGGQIELEIPQNGGWRRFGELRMAEVGNVAYEQRRSGGSNFPGRKVLVARFFHGWIVAGYRSDSEHWDTRGLDRHIEADIITLRHAPISVEVTPSQAQNAISVGLVS